MYFSANRGDTLIVSNIMIGVTAITEPWKGVTANSQNDTEAERKQLLLLLAWHYQDNVVTQTLQPLCSRVQISQIFRGITQAPASSHDINQKTCQAEVVTLITRRAKFTVGCRQSVGISPHQRDWRDSPCALRLTLYIFVNPEQTSLSVKGC